MYPIIKISEELYIPTYILIISLTFCVGIIWTLFRSGRRKMDYNETINLCLAIMIGGFFGARSLHIFYEAPDFYLAHPLNVFKVWQGGFVFYGGALGALIISWGWIRYKSLDFFAWADLFTPIFAAGYGIGRIACFLNGCCYGAVCELPWAIHFPNLSDHIDIARHPTQLYASVWEFFVVAILLHLEFWSRPERITKADPITRRFAHFPTGSLFLVWVMLHSMGRLGMEYFRDDPRGFDLLGLSISTWLSLMFFTLSVRYLFKVKASAR